MTASDHTLKLFRNLLHQWGHPYMQEMLSKERHQTATGPKSNLIAFEVNARICELRFDLGMMPLVSHVSETLYSSTAFDPRIACRARSSGMRVTVISNQVS